MRLGALSGRWPRPPGQTGRIRLYRKRRGLGRLRDSQAVRSGDVRRKNTGHNILRQTPLEGAELGTRHPNILGFEELPARPATTTCRMAGLVDGRRVASGSGYGDSHV